MQAPVRVAAPMPATVEPIAAPLLWLADIAPARNAAWAARQIPLLSSSERRRFDRIQAVERRAQLLAGHVLLRRLLAAAARVEPGAIVIGSDEAGRPCVDMPAGWGASLAHSGCWVAALVSAGQPAPGVDIERHKPQRDILAIVRSACGVDAASAEEAYLVWAQHEAELKAGHSDTEVWVATWQGHAVAACAGGPPRAAVAQLDAEGAPQPIDLAWTHRDRLPSTAAP